MGSQAPVPEPTQRPSIKSPKAPPQPNDHTKPDWRIGLSVKVKYRSHPMYYERGTIIETYPSGTGGIADKDGVIKVQA